LVVQAADGRRLGLLSGGKTGSGAISACDEGDRPLNLEVHKRLDAKLERQDSCNEDRDSMSGNVNLISRDFHVTCSCTIILIIIYIVAKKVSRCRIINKSY